MKLLGRLFGGKPRPPEPHHVENVAGTMTWIVRRDRDGRQVAGPFDTIGEANDCEHAYSAGKPWRYGPDTTQWKQDQGYIR